MEYGRIVMIGENNLCRSFMAEVILRGLLQKRGVSGVEVISRGLVVLFSEPVSPMARGVLHKHGYAIDAFRSSQLSEEDLVCADLALTMTGEQAEKVKKDFGTKTACMSVGTFIDLDEDMPKVTEDTAEAFEECFRSIETWMEAVADRVIGELLP